ncbi:MAG: 23S rRNA (guanosine(2251)-2'-O)-methyltransferase RlmB [Acidimicrobiia bacterium]|nr:23S rRNA (guanosine(2251)-2'-O)-methyltransferase RlmB [Acidimicrobiia bacterium]
MRRRDRDHGEIRGLGGDRVEGRHAVKELLLAGTRPVRQVVLAADQDPSPILDDIIDLADEAGVDIRELPRGRFEQMAATDAPQGVVAFAAPLREYAVEELLAQQPAGPPNSLYLSAGAEHAEGRTPAPPPEAGEEAPELAETTEGAEGTDDAEEAAAAAGAASDTAEGDDVADEEEPSDAAAQADPADADGTADRRAASAATLLLVLDGIVDPGNLGAILRTAECAGVTGVVLPRHRAARITPTVAKRAAGAIEHLRFAPVSGIPTALATLAEQGVWSVGLDVTADQTIWQLDLADAPLALVLGAEGRGLSRLVRRRCDVTTRIPTAGKLDSLNAAAAGSIALFEVMRRRAAP